MQPPVCGNPKQKPKTHTLAHLVSTFREASQTDLDKIREKIHKDRSKKKQRDIENGKMPLFLHLIAFNETMDALKTALDNGDLRTLKKHIEEALSRIKEETTNLQEDNPFRYNLKEKFVRTADVYNLMLTTTELKATNTY